ncbi:probable leucine-rich repeat receptor-like protein kinase At2g33170 [Spinacia oleracea]|uniref:Probable leucine-rich repeat receptor-like protein kinase At2g33170 n=1 Tax=Spinacia oleracea TaxID=3562 RepID=A0ABM3RH29_SPIOL|nr:probable leucine-rich repeat receptor-like protein kinase At2g33170 [Spinacia oleracea]
MVWQCRSEGSHWGSASVQLALLLLLSQEDYNLMQRNSLSGKIPLSLTNLGNISKFELFRNKLFCESSTYFLTNWTKLTSLQIYGNTFSGIIPPEIGQLTKLEYLYLYQNNFSGSIPSDIGNLKVLFGLDLSTYKLSGPIPPTIGNLHNLSVIALYQLTGTIPPEIGNLTSLTTLYLNINHLHGELPYTLSNLQKLMQCLIGEIPKIFADLASLVHLKLFFDDNVLLRPQFSVFCLCL